MYEIKTFNPEQLDDTQRIALEKLTEPDFHCCLKGKPPYDVQNTKIFGVSAFFQGEPVGIILASMPFVLKRAIIHTFFVTEEHRNKKIGTQMLVLLEKELKRTGCTFISLNYQAGHPTAPNLERILLHLRWSTPDLTQITCFFDCPAFHPDWFQKSYPKSRHTLIFPWKRLKPSERQILLKEEHEGVFPDYLSPFKDENLIEPINSLGLRYKGKVIGWIITHRIKPDLIRYGSLFIQRPYRYRGDSIKLLIESIRRQQNSSVRWSEFVLNVVLADYYWVKFVRKRLAPYAQSVTETKISVIDLTANLDYL